MKRLISLMLCAVMMFACFGEFCLSASAAPAYKVGDVNGDGSINMLDVAALLAQVAELSPVNDVDAADINADLKVNAKDLLFLRKSLVGTVDIDEMNPTPEFGTVGRIRIGGNNIKHYEIVNTNPDNANMVFAASQLRRYVKEATGIELSVVDSSTSKYRIVIMEDTTGALGNDGFTLSVNDGVLTIMGGALRGTMYGVAELLEDYFGYRFYGNSVTKLEDVATVDVPEGLSDTQIPDTTYRSITSANFGSSHLEKTTTMRKVNGSISGLNSAKYGYSIERMISNAHSFDVFIANDFIKPCLTSDLPKADDIEEYYKTDDFWAEYDEYPLNMDLKKEWSVQVDFHSSVYDECIATMDYAIRQRKAWGQTVGKEITEISCSYAIDPADGGVRYCVCTKCRKLMDAEGTRAAHLVDFVNAVAEVIQFRHPGITILTNAYGDTCIPPKTKKLNDGIILLYCWNGCANHPIGSGLCGDNTNEIGRSNTISEENYLGWLEKGTDLYIWYYPTNIYYMLAPLPNVFSIYDDFKWLIEHGAKGFYVKATEGDSFEGLITYLASEMMWDKDITREEYLDMACEYLEYHYGEGWENIYRYAEMLDEASEPQGCFMTEYDWPLTMYNEEYMASHYDEMKAMFSEALAAAGSDWQRENVLKLSASMHFLGLASTYYSNYRNGSAEEKAEYAETYRAWYDLVNEYNVMVDHSRRGFDLEFNADVHPIGFVYPKLADQYK